MNDEPSKPPTMDDLLMLAVAEWGYPIEQAQADHVTANGLLVIEQGLRWAGAWNDENRSSLRRENYNATVGSWYSRLLEICREQPTAVEAAGLPEDGRPYCCATYAAFGLTDLGWKIARSLRQRFPKILKSDIEGYGRKASRE